MDYGAVLLTQRKTDYYYQMSQCRISELHKSASDECWLVNILRGPLKPFH